MPLTPRLPVRAFRALALSSAFLAALSAPPLRAGSPPPAEDVAVTVYNDDLALVREVRRLELPAGRSRVRIEDVAARIDPTSVHLAALDEPGTLRVLEQNFEYDLVHPARLLEKYLGREVLVVRQDPETGQVAETGRGRLLSTGWDRQVQPWDPAPAYVSTGSPVIEIDGKIHLTPPGSIVLPALPEGLIARPTLVWDLESARAGERRAELSYLARGLSWSADYVAVADPRRGKLDLTGWVTLHNRSGAAYRDARLKLVAGDVHQVAPPGMAGIGGRAMALDSAAPAPSFEERAFSEYHLYELQRRTTLRENEQKQIELLAAGSVPFEKVYVYDGARMASYQGWDESTARSEPAYGTESNTKVSVMIEFQNREAAGLGIPLPAGRIRVYEADADGSQEFTGEDRIGHTPRDERVRLHTGNAFDLVGDRRQTNFNRVSDRVVEESFAIDVRNHKDEAVTVRVVEHLYRWSEWKATSSTLPFEKTDSRTLEFRPTVPPRGEVRIEYTVRYSW